MSDDSEPYSSELYRPRRSRTRNEKIKRGAVIAGVATVATGAGVAASNEGEILKKALIPDPITREYMDEHGWDSSLALRGMVDRTGTPNPTVALRLKEELRKESDAVTMADIVVSGYEFQTSETRQKDNVLDSPEAYAAQEKQVSKNAFSYFGADYSNIVYGDSFKVVQEAQIEAIENVIQALEDTSDDRGAVDHHLVSVYFRLIAAEVAQQERGVPQEDQSYNYGGFENRMRSTLAEGEKFSQEEILSWIQKAQQRTVELFHGTLSGENAPNATRALINLTSILGGRNETDGSLDWNNLSKLVEYECDEYGCHPVLLEPDYLQSLLSKSDMDFSEFSQGGSVPWYVFRSYLWEVYHEYREDRDPHAVDSQIHHRMFAVVQSIRSDPSDQHEWYDAMEWSSYEREDKFAAVVELLAGTYRDIHFDPALVMFDVADHLNDDYGAQEPTPNQVAERIKGYLDIVQDAVEKYEIEEKDQALFYRFVRNYILRDVEDPNDREDREAFDIDPLVKVFQTYTETIRQDNLRIGNFEWAYQDPASAWAIIDTGVPRYIVDSYHSIQSTDVLVFSLILDEVRGVVSDEKEGEVPALISFLFDLSRTPMNGGMHPHTPSAFLSWVRENPDLVSESASLFEKYPQLYTDLVDSDEMVSFPSFYSAEASVVGYESTDTLEPRIEDLQYAVSVMDAVLQKVPEEAIWNQGMIGYFLYRAALYHRAHIDAERELSLISSAEYIGFGYMIPVSESSMMRYPGEATIPDGVIRLDNGTVVINDASSAGSIIFNGDGALTAQEHRDLFPTMDSSDVARYGNYDAIVIRADGVSVIDPVGEYDTIDDYTDHFGESAGGDPFIVGLPPEDANAFLIVTNGEVLIYVPDTPPEFTNMDALSDYIQSALGANEVGVIPVSIRVRESSTPTSVPLPS